jgi:hypothetical protein
MVFNISYHEFRELQINYLCIILNPVQACEGYGVEK